jgi:hypothetical protein
LRFIVRLEDPSSIDSPNFTVVLGVGSTPEGSLTAPIFSLRESYSRLRARDVRSIILRRPFTIPMDVKNLYIWVGIDKFPGEDWPDNQYSDQKAYQLPGVKLYVTGAHTYYKYERILPYPLAPRIDIPKIPRQPVK